MRQSRSGVAIVLLAQMAGLAGVAWAQVAEPVTEPAPAALPAPVPAPAPAAVAEPVAVAAPARVDSYQRDVRMGWSGLASTDAIPEGAIRMIGDGHWEVPAKLAPKILGVELSALPEKALELRGEVNGRQAVIVIACTLDLDAREARDARAGVKAAARPFVDAIAQEIPAFIRQAQEQQAARGIAPQVEQMNLGKVRAAETAKQVEELREQIRKATGRGFVDVAGIRQWAASIENERQALTLELSGMVQRRGTLKKQLAEFGQKVEQATNTDNSIQELENVVKLRSAAVERARALVDQGRVPVGDLTAAQIALGEAQAQLAAQRRVVAQAAGADRMAALAAEQSQLDAREVEIDGRLDQISQKRAGLAGLDAALDRLEQLTATTATHNAGSEQTAVELSRRFLTPPLWITVREK